MADRGPRDDDDALWRAVKSDIKPLRGRKRRSAIPTIENAPADPAKSPGRIKENLATVAARPALPPVPPTAPPASRRPPPSPPLSLDASPGVDKRTAERLKRGQLEIEARIDLHGLTQREAHQVLANFLEGARAERRRAVLVITGKGDGGQGVLREAVPRWLNEAAIRPLILAFTHAQPRDGGTGALYILLRRAR
jgi:DNA-nicking Smr family endonuclease